MTPEEREQRQREIDDIPRQLESGEWMRKYDENRKRELDKQCRNFHSQATGTIDQWIQELNDLSGLTTQDIDADVWDAMRLRVLDELDATRDGTPERARALWMAVGCHYWVQRGLNVAMEGEE